MKSIDLFAGIGGIRIGFDKAFGKNLMLSILVDTFSSKQFPHAAILCSA